MVQDIRFQGQRLRHRQGLRSLMTGAVKGKPVAEAEAMVEQFRGMIRGDLEPGAQTPLLGKLTLFSGVKNLPSRVKCAVLPWATLHAALKGERPKPARNDPPCPRSPRSSTRPTPTR